MSFTDGIFVPAMDHKFRIRIIGGHADPEFLMNQAVGYELKSEYVDDEIQQRISITYEVDCGLRTTSELFKLNNSLTVEIFSMDGSENGYHSVLIFDGRLVSVATGQNYSSSDVSKAILVAKVSNRLLRLPTDFKKLPTF